MRIAEKVRYKKIIKELRHRLSEKDTALDYYIELLDKESVENNKLKNLLGLTAARLFDKFGGFYYIKKLYNGLTLISDAKETLTICMRDSGFEFKYGEKWYEAKLNNLQLLQKTKTKENDFCSKIGNTSEL